jgi:translation initiation factor 3 subunit E
LTTAVIINKTARLKVMKDLVKVIQEEAYTYRDPITSFIEDLCVNFDFKGAQQKLRECETVIVNDFFLVSMILNFFLRHLAVFLAKVPVCHLATLGDATQISLG